MTLADSNIKEKPSQGGLSKRSFQIIIVGLTALSTVLAALLGSGLVNQNVNTNTNNITNNIVYQLPPSDTDNFDDVVTNTHFPFIGKWEWIGSGGSSSDRFPLMAIDRDNQTQRVTVEIFDRCDDPPCSLGKRPAQHAFGVLTSTIVLEDGTTYFMRAEFASDSGDLIVMIEAIDEPNAFKTSGGMKRIAEA